MEMKKYRYAVYIFIVLSVLPFLLLFQDFNRSHPFTAYGSFAGLVGTVLLMWQIALGLRFIASNFSTDTVWFNNLHKNLGRYGILIILLHPILKIYTYFGGLEVFLRVGFSDPNFIFGIIAVDLLLLIWFTSVFLRKKLGFRLWKYIHFTSYILVALTFLHASSVGTYLNRYPLLKTYWFILFGIFLSFLIYRFLTFMGVGSVKHKLIKKEKFGEINVYTFESLGKAIKPKAGQYCHIKLKKFGEEHPFTVMEADADSKTLTFGVKTEGKFTKNLDKLDVGQVVMVDGPYGIFTSEGHTDKEKVIIAAGVGVTPFVEVVKKYGNELTYMITANRNLNSALKRQDFKKTLGDRYYDVLSQDKTTGENIFNQRLNREILEEILPAEIIKKANYFICGTKSFYITCVKILTSLGVKKSKIFYEEFGF